MFTAFKVLLTAGLIYLVTEIVVKHGRPLLGSLVASLPVVSIITFVWLYHGLRDQSPAERAERIASHSMGVFWFVLPSLPLFVLFPWLLRQGAGFWPALAAGCGTSLVAYLLMSQFLKQAGLEL